MPSFPRLLAFVSLATIAGCNSARENLPETPAAPADPTRVMRTLSAMPAFADRLGRGQRLALHEGTYQLARRVGDTPTDLAHWVPTDARTARLDARIPALAKGALRIAVSEAFWMEIGSGVEADVVPGLPRVIDGAV